MKCANIPLQLQTGFHAANALLPDTDRITVRFEAAPCLTLTMDGDTVVIGYSRKAEALRGMSMVKRFAASPAPIRQTAKFDTLTVMADCSRDAVLKPEKVKELMVTIAMMGFNALMLYTEDTYEIPGQPYFGHMRGRYSVDELKALNAYSEEIGIELIPCIQTLAHVNGIFYWPVYAQVRDIDDILLAEDEKTYDLIEQMLRTCRDCFSSKRIHVGMDEAHHLGRGAYTDRNGYSTKADIILRHLDKVVELCKQYDFEPIMWSDMFFRMQFNGLYFVTAGELSPEVLAKIPEGVNMCYWDYYTPPVLSNRLDHMFSQHAAMKRPLWFAGGSWNWRGPVPKNYFSNYVTPNQLAYAQKYGVKNVIATIWGDDGGDCTLWNMFPSLLQYGELNYGDADEQTMEQRCMDCFDMHYSDLLLLDQVGKPDVVDNTRRAPECLEKMALFNDPLMGMMDASLRDRGLPEKYTRDSALLAQVSENRFAPLFHTQLALAKLLAVKATLSLNIKDAYRSGAKATLSHIAQEEIPTALQCLEEYHRSFAAQWHWLNRPFGYEVHDLRLGGARARLLSAQQRIGQYLNGELAHLEELEQPDLPRDPARYVDDLNSWEKTATPNWFKW